VASVPERIRARVKFESFERAIFPEKYFDLVTLWHVLEHMPEPLAALQQVYRLLKPGGRIVIEVPNLASVEAHWLGRHWYHLDVPFHFWHFTPRSLRTMALKAGFQVEAQRTATLFRPILLINYLRSGANCIYRWCKAETGLPPWSLIDRGLRLVSVPVCVAERVGLFFSTPTMRLVATKP